MTFGSLFAGIGGFDLGLERAGFRCAWQVEINPWARTVLTKHWPDVPKYEDVRAVGAHNLSRVTVICGGFPCQDLSVAGKRAGLGGQRSGLFYELMRVVRELEPEWVVFENVPGLLSSHGGRDFHAVLQEMADGGFRRAYRILDSQHFGVAQRRRRVFLVGSARASGGDPTQVLIESTGLRGDSAAGQEAGRDVAYALTASVRGSGDGHGNAWNSTYVTGEANTRVAPSDATVVAFQSTASFDFTGTTIAPTLKIGSGIGLASPPAVAFVQNQRQEVWELAVAGALSTVRRGDAKQETLVAAYDERNITSPTNRSNPTPDDPCHTLHASPPLLAGTLGAPVGGGFRTTDLDSNGAYIVKPGHLIATTLLGHSLGKGRGTQVDGHGDYPVSSTGVRRLTPTECERLQAFPDGHTCLCGVQPYTTATCQCPDTPRYAGLGNAVTVSVIEWIGRRLMAAIRLQKEATA